jgi:D-serine deaminase-like pyridoxal phosphate-dependent protein
MSDLSTAPQAGTHSLLALDTPCLILDEARMNSNIARLRSRLYAAGVALRPHLKTAKSLDVSRRLVTGGNGPGTVSTLREAEEFAAGGLTDLTYAVGISPCKIARVQALRARGVNMTILLDSVEQARAVAAASDSADPLQALIEIDCDGHRSGVKPGDHETLTAIAQALAPSAEMRGVLTHAGESYHAHGREQLEAAAETERASVVRAAGILREQGFSSPVVSVGSTPTAHFAKSFAGVTEVRAGVYVFFDLVQAGIGVCTVDDIALSVLTTVIGHQREKGWTIVDAGWMAMAGDRSTASQAVDQGYGLACDLSGRPIPNLIMAGANQEHGILALRQGASGRAPELPVGTRLRILPNHACATAAQHDRYHVIGEGAGGVTAEWPRFSGW